MPTVLVIVQFYSDAILILTTKAIKYLSFVNIRSIQTISCLNYAGTAFFTASIQEMFAENQIYMVTSVTMV